jgi:hypothetical protein
VRSHPRRFRFRSVWLVRNAEADAFDILHAVDEYPSWWPEVKEARRIDPEAFAMRVRSALPYELRFRLEQEEVDRSRGVLRARLTGDLDGTSAWTVRSDTVRFDEDVRLAEPRLSRLTPLARPAFRWNHAAMMRSAERGLRAALAGFRVARGTEEAGPASPT